MARAKKVDTAKISYTNLPVTKMNADVCDSFEDYETWLTEKKIFDDGMSRVKFGDFLVMERFISACSSANKWTKRLDITQEEIQADFQRVTPEIGVRNYPVMSVSQIAGYNVSKYGVFQEP